MYWNDLRELEREIKILANRIKRRINCDLIFINLFNLKIYNRNIENKKDITRVKDKNEKKIIIDMISKQFVFKLEDLKLR